MGVQLNEDKQWAMTFANSFAQVAANTIVEQTVTVKGLKRGDRCLHATKITAQTGLGVMNYRVSGDDTLALTFINATGSPITPTANDTYSVVILRPEKTYTGVPY